MERIPLNTLQEGKEGRIVHTSPQSSHGARRLADLGMIEGTKIRCLYKSPLKDPTAYEIRGTVVALRKEDCQHIYVETDQFDWGKIPCIALAGNPNVGKSTVFNCLTGLRQHTGNWAGKTVGSAAGRWRLGDKLVELVDIPGCYSLEASAAEEALAQDFICSHDCDGVIVVCDATCLERNLILALQIKSRTVPMGICINLMDQARRRHIKIDAPALSKLLGVPVVTTEAGKKKEMKAALRQLAESILERPEMPEPLGMSEASETPETPETSETSEAPEILGMSEMPPQEVVMEAERNAVQVAMEAEHNAVQVVMEAERIAAQVVSQQEEGDRISRPIDRLLTSPVWGFPAMGLLFLLVFWITIKGANYPSQLLSTGLFRLETPFLRGLESLGLPDFFCQMIACGMYRVLAWVISVMLPPMAIFFPLFALLEDWGFLPRVAFNLDRCFHCCSACGKQALTMCMGLGCNASGVVGCRIIDSERERLMAMITNVLMPCNGRFPILITIITLFFTGGAAYESTGSGAESGALATNLLAPLLLTGVIFFAIGATLLLSKLLSITVLKGVPSSFTLELPPFRRPNVIRLVLRSVIDRTLLVLARAAAVAAPAGLVIWLLANLQVGDGNLLTLAAGFLDPLGKAIGLDGVILLSFLLGLPANEIVMPIIMMIYMSQTTLSEVTDLTFFHQLLVENGWTTLTAVNMLLFTLMHWPCATTLLSIGKESKSLKWAVIAVIAPLTLGLIFCSVTTAFSCIIG